MKDLSANLARRKAEHLYRRRLLLEGPQGTEVLMDGCRYLSFCSNDYLGLANNPDVIKALQQGADQYGVGSGAAHLVTGHSKVHHELEDELAEFVQRPRALLFSTGYMANLGIAGALIGHGSYLYEDRLNHASLVDAGRLCDGKMIRYRHADVEDLKRRLEGHGADDCFIASDGVFSMDGDLAPTVELSKLAKLRHASLWIDDAHGLGVLGANGRGTLELAGLGIDEVPIFMGTLGKALGTFGAFVAGSEDLIETLIQEARTYVYTTAIPAPVAAATRTSLRLVKKESWRRGHLQELVRRFREGAGQLGLPIMDSITPIQPIVVGDAKRCVSISEALRSKGILITAIRPPTVPKDTARLRITFSANHSTEHVDRLLECLGTIFPVDETGQCATIDHGLVS